MNYEILIAEKGIPWEIILPKNIKKDIHKEIYHPIVYDRFQKKAFCLSCGEYFDYGFKVGDTKRTYHIVPKFRADAQIQCPLCGHTARAWPHTRPVFTYRNFVTAEKSRLRMANGEITGHARTAFCLRSLCGEEFLSTQAFWEP